MDKKTQHENRHQDKVTEQDNLRRCLFHQEVIEYALDRIDKAKANGRITVQDYAFLHEKYSEKHARVAQTIDTHQKIIRLAELEATKTQLLHAFHEKIHPITNELSEMKTIMSVPQPVVQPAAQPVVPSAAQRARLTSDMRAGSDKWSWTSLNGFAVLAIAVILLIVSSTYSIGFLTNQQFLSPDGSNQPITTPPNTINQTTTSSTGLTASLELGVYQNQTTMQAVTQIDWGIVYPDDSLNYSLYLVNEGNVPCHLVLTTANWQPSHIMEQITVTWDYNDEIVEPNQGVILTLTLTTASNLENIGAFTFDLTITSSSIPS